MSFQGSLFYGSWYKSSCFTIFYFNFMLKDISRLKFAPHEETKDIFLLNYDFRFYCTIYSNED